MSIYIEKITFMEAIKLAEDSARKNLERYIDSPTIPILDERFEEAECCWFFFRNKQIEGPPEQALRWDCAYAVSKKGDVSIIGDLSDEPEKLTEYLQVMSNYFKERGL